MNQETASNLGIGRYGWIFVLLLLSLLGGCRLSASREEPADATPRCFTLGEELVSHSPWGFTVSRLQAYEHRLVFAAFQGRETVLVLVDLETPENTQHVHAREGQVPLFPVIHGDRLAWAEDLFSDSQIYVYDLRTGEKELIAAPGSDLGDLALYEEHLVWRVWPEEEPCLAVDKECLTQLKYRNLSTGTEEYLGTGQVEGGIHLWDTYLAYTARNEDRDLDIVLYDLTTGEEEWLITGEDDQTVLELQGAQLLYSPRKDKDSWNSEVCVFNLVD